MEAFITTDEKGKIGQLVRNLAESLLFKCKVGRGDGSISIFEDTCTEVELCEILDTLGLPKHDNFSITYSRDHSYVRFEFERVADGVHQITSVKAVDEGEVIEHAQIFHL